MTTQSRRVVCPHCGADWTLFNAGEDHGFAGDYEPPCYCELSPSGYGSEDAAPLPACCPGCGGEMQQYDDGEYTSRCEDCGWVRP